ncbi:MAG: signal peptidase I [Proteobacteria bacterium]|uniref:signal peptidase I n=1 Tax=Rudaea sp. TaxID=2136325 RepID=UPI001D3DC8CC|nr:signal peptidase I [Pseudomonadota bacterium]MBS0566116.1 signal peptidase I [Pseudomonadota bacterium]
MWSKKRIVEEIAANKSLLLFLGLMLCFRSAVADWMVVPTGSMNPTIVEGDRILVDKAAYGLRIPFTEVRLTHGADPQRGDIVIFPSPKDGMTLVKRVIGLPGDTITLRGEHLYINGNPLDYAPAQSRADEQLPRATRGEQREYFTETLGEAAHPIMVLPRRNAMRSFGPVTVPEGRYFMMGDSRDNSEDSRYFGFVPREAIVGRAFRVAYSLDADRWYRPRTDRFFSPLN